MHEWTKKIHMYAGLLSYAAFVVWGITGIHAISLPMPGQWKEPPVTSERTIPFEAPGNLDDKALAVEVFRASGVSMAPPPPNARRDDDLNLVFSTWGPNGRSDYTYYEDEGRIRVEHKRGSLSGFFSSMHTASTRRGAPDLPVRLWGFYNEFSLWAFVFMTISGVYLWLASRPKLRWAWYTFGGGAALFIVLWIAS